MDEIKAGLSDAEREALNALWDRGTGTVRQLLELIEARGRQWVYSTVATLLRRLESKGYATSESMNGSLVYRAALSREDLLERRLKEAAAELCDGAAVPLVLALVQGNRFTTEELDRIRRIIDEAKTKVVRRKER
ncbi:MAG TPA: BlaI/MecI/CopY family transcriptional regulator [Planctomycetaceae bacterium]|jgi:predicted transcriptional regulator|nr:BlaI/MecI/CopY family transcriptional regulator [Planctomycetaceae bacterium]